MLYTTGMIDRSVRRTGTSRSPQGDAKKASGRANLDYWLSRPTEERLSAVEFLRRQYYGRGAAGLRRVVSVSQRT